MSKLDLIDLYEVGLNGCDLLLPAAAYQLQAEKCPQKERYWPTINLLHSVFNFCRFTAHRLPFTTLLTWPDHGSQNI